MGKKKGKNNVKASAEHAADAINLAMADGALGPDAVQRFGNIIGGIAFRSAGGTAEAIAQAALMIGTAPFITSAGIEVEIDALVTVNAAGQANPTQMTMVIQVADIRRGGVIVGDLFEGVMSVSSYRDLMGQVAAVVKQAWPDAAQADGAS